MVVQGAPYFCGACSASYDERLSYCVRCGAFYRMLPHAPRPVDAYWSADHVTNAEEVYAEPSLSPLRPYPIKVGHPTLVSIYGPPGGGKSTMATKIADRYPGVALYIPQEEGIGDALRSRLKRLEVSRRDLLIAMLSDTSGIDRTVEEHGVGLLVLDSITSSTLQAGDLLRLARDRELTVIMTVQVTKEDRMAGSMKLSHDPDVVVRVSDMMWEVEKSRFDGLVGGAV